MRLALFVCVGVLGACPCSGQPSPQGPPGPQRLTERDAVARFAEADPRIRALTARIDEVRAAQAERTLWPNPSATYSRESVVGAHDTFLLARQELPISGRRGRLQLAGRLAVDAARADAQWQRGELQADLRDAYTALMLAQEREAALRGSIEALHTLVAALRAREEGGEGSTYDRMRGERALVDLQAESARAQGRLAGYLGAGAAPEALVAADSLRTAAAEAPLPALIEQALARRGDYRAATISVARFDAERSAAARLLVPTGSVGGGLKRSDFAGATNSGYQFSFDVAVPLFSRGQAAGALATAQKSRAEAEAESWRLQIESEVRAAYNVVRIHR